MRSQPPVRADSKLAEIADEIGFVAERYQVLEEIGRGGLAVIHRARDTLSERDVALKRLLRKGLASSAAALFEREFHTLSQLSHPRIVQAYDYGVTPAGAFYTMELLDGGDVQSLSPLDFARACALMRDVCSALCLLHSRRLVHRDISPRNIRCTTQGLAKLIDFGAMIPMGSSAQIVGTPPFCAPEVVEMQPLDARTDLYSLGTTLYFALTGRHAYPARSLQQLESVWQSPPPSPSLLVEGIPRALDDLVMELIQLDPRSRPSHAAVVMERLSAIANLALDEQLVVSQAYLSTPTLVGRERKLARVRKHLRAARGGDGRAILVEAAGGLGRTRFLDACALEAKLLGFTVVRASAAAAHAGDYGAAQTMGRQLLDAHPETARALAQPYMESLPRVLAALRTDASAQLASETMNAEQRVRVQEALRSWVADMSDRQPLALVVDDVDQLDEPSAALLALLAHASDKHALSIIASADSTRVDGGDGPLRVLRDASSSMTLGPLSPPHSEQLLASIFGEAAHLGFVAQRLHRVSGGNPRDLMQLAQHLVDRGVARYHAGSWTLAAQIDEADLPESMTRALAHRLAHLSPAARELGQAFALTPNDAWSVDECLALTGKRLSALDELVAAGVLRSDEQRHALSQPAWAAPLLSGLSPQRRRKLHERIAELFAARGENFRSGQHLLWAGRHAEALDVLVEHARTTKALTDRDHLAWARLQRTLPRDYRDSCEAALRLCDELQRPEAERYALRTRMSSVLSAYGHDIRDLIVAVVGQCRRDAGLDLYAQLDEEIDQGERLQQALAAAQARHDALSERERVFAPLEALRPLGAAVVEALGVASNSYDRALWRDLPDLQPLSPLSPTFGVLDRVRSSVGERLAGRYERAREGYTAALQRLEQPDHAGLADSYYYAVRDGVLFARALVDAAMGTDAVLDALERLDSGPSKLGALRLRMLHSLWQGDGEAADEQRRQYELARVQSSLAINYEGGLLFTELCALACCDDLSRLRRIMPDIERWAKQAASWQPMLCYARGSQRRIGGDFVRALHDVRQGLSLAKAGEHQLWPMLAGAEVQCLLELGEAAEAVAAGRRHRARARERGVDFPAHYIDMPLSLALSALDQVDAARELAQSVVARLLDRGTRGLPLGLAYHNLALICLAARDADAFRDAAVRCGELFEHSSSQALATKYRRLMREARKAERSTMKGVELISQTDWDSGIAQTYLTSVFDACTGVEERARIAATVLAKHYQTESAFVYVPDGDAASLVATVGCHEPPPQLAELVGDCLAVELGQAEDATATACGAGSGMDTDPLWIGAEDERFYPVVLGHHEARGFVISAVVVVALGAANRFAHPGRIAAELSRLGLGAVPETSRIVVRRSDTPQDDDAVNR